MDERGSKPFHDRGGVRGRCRAFTLIEVMLSLALVVLLLGSVFAFAYQLLGSRRAISAAADQARLASVLADQLDPAIATTLAAHGAYGSGIVGKGDSLRVLTRSVLLPMDADEAAGWPADLLQFELRFNAASGAVEMARGFPGDDIGSRAWEVVANRVRAMRWRYSDGSRWHEEYDSGVSGLPAAIEMSIWLESGGPGAPQLEEPEGELGPATLTRTIAIHDGGADANAVALGEAQP